MENMQEETKNDSVKNPVTVPIRFRIPPRTPSFFAEEVAFNQRATGEIVMTFFETVPPPVPEDAQQQEEFFKRLQAEGIIAEAQVRLTVPQSTFLKFLDAANQVRAQMLQNANERE